MPQTPVLSLIRATSLALSQSLLAPSHVSNIRFVSSLCSPSSASGATAPFSTNFLSRNARMSFHVFGSRTVSMKRGERPTGCFRSEEIGFMSSTLSRSIGMEMEGPRLRPPPVIGVPGEERGVLAPEGEPGAAGEKAGEPKGGEALPPGEPGDLELLSVESPARLSKLLKSVVRVMEGTRACLFPPLGLVSEELEVVLAREAAPLLPDDEERAFDPEKLKGV